MIATYPDTMAVIHPRRLSRGERATGQMVERVRLTSARTLYPGIVLGSARGGVARLRAARVHLTGRLPRRDQNREHVPVRRQPQSGKVFPMDARTIGVTDVGRLGSSVILLAG